MWEMKARRWKEDFHTYEPERSWNGDGNYEDAEAQLQKYTRLSNGEFVRGFDYSSYNADLWGTLSMNIISLGDGKLAYDFYYDDHGTNKPIETAGARNYILKWFPFMSDTDVLDYAN